MRATSNIKPKRIVVTDDHSNWLDGLKADLGPNFSIVGEATDADEAIEIIERTEPDLVLTDLHMPGGGGLAVARAVAERFPVLMLTASNDEPDLLEAVAAGAVGYLVKSTAPDDLRDKLWRAASGEPVFSPSLAALVLNEFRRLRRQLANGQGLSDSEREVLQLVARGHTYAEIGDELFISHNTVDNHVRSILHKLKLTRGNEPVRFAVQHGID